MSFVAVDVIDFGLIVGIVNERSRHQNMNAENPIFSVFKTCSNERINNHG